MNCPIDRIKITHDESQKLHKINMILENMKIIADSAILKIGARSIKYNQKIKTY